MSHSKRIFKSPVGVSQHPWNIPSRRTHGPVTCELCGTEWVKAGPDSPGYVLGRVLGRVFVEGCCGRVVDLLYKDLGMPFALKVLEDFAENPTDVDYGPLRQVLPEILRKARQNLDEVDATLAASEPNLAQTATRP